MRVLRTMYSSIYLEGLPGASFGYNGRSAALLGSPMNLQISIFAQETSILGSIIKRGFFRGGFVSMSKYAASRDVV